MLSTLSRRLRVPRLSVVKAPSRPLTSVSRLAPQITARAATALSVRVPVAKSFVRGIAQDKELASVISSELKEEEVPTAPQLPEHYQLTHDVEGDTMVELKRKFEVEEITIRFQVEPPDASYPEETDQEEDLEAAMTEHMTPEQKQAMELEQRQMEQQEEEGEEEDDNPYADAMLSFSVLINKPKTGKAVEIQCLSDQGVLFVNHVCTYDDAKLLKSTTDNDYKKTFLYQGPVMADLPQELRGQIAEYLARRGVDDDMAKFVLEYVWFKEQSEYVRFLKTFHSIVSA